jgi:hypothetical protein
MNSPTQPITGHVAPADTKPANPAEAFTECTPGTTLGARPPLIGARRGTPPPEVLEEIVHAEAALAQLHGNGQAVRFTEADGAGAMRIELVDLDGVVLRALTPLEAIELACAETTEQ